MTVKLHVYETNLGLFVKQDGYPSYLKPKVNGQEIDFPSGQYLFFRDVFEIKSFEILKTGGKKHIGYVLKISSIANEEIPLELSVEQVEPYYNDDTEQWEWKSYSDYRALYKETYEVLEDIWELQELEITVIRKLHIENYENPAEMKVGVVLRDNVPNSYSSSDSLASIVYYDDFERLLTPEFLLHERPCKLTSPQVYSIVRHHIKNNINPACAAITSDYDFCFTVKRKVAIKPYVNKTEIKTARGRSYSTPKFRTNSVQHKEVELFEMTHTGQNYKGYTPIAGWEASSLRDMKDQMEHYLKTLMDEINTPVVECVHCNGMGHIVQKIKTNEREVNDE